MCPYKRPKLCSERNYSINDIYTTLLFSSLLFSIEVVNSLLLRRKRRRMASAAAEATTTIHSSKASSMGLAGEMEVEAYRRLFPLPFYERHLQESVRPDARPLSRSRETSVALGPVATADGSALVKIGETTMLAAVKLEVMMPSSDSPDQGCVGVEFHMPPICSPTVRPGRPAEAAPVISKQLSNVIMSSGMIDSKELSLISGKAAWMAYLDIYCLNADGSLFDAALLSAIAAFSHLQIPLVSVNDDGRVIAVSGEPKDESKLKLVNKEKRKLSLRSIPFSLTCMLHKKYIFVDPTAEEESIMETTVTVVLDSLGRLVSVHKAGGSVLAYNSTLQECIALTKRRVEELRKILEESLLAMEVD
ncbi:exosome complex component RRP43 [Iris pallida]|uniref:Ribosomal RNA-processing protein 43 n=1 Tax=Iris pallida TaxID=29817 RepID=A0AAX6GVP0_IRIPA|nr:exosome complex component RRP43 [Iris pallida]